MKRMIPLLLIAIMICSMTACSNRVVVPDEGRQNNPSSGTTITPSKDYGDEDVPNNEIVVPDPPEAKKYLSGLWRNYDCTQTSVDVEGLQAIYSISAKQDNRLVDCAGTYTLILEYDDAESKWNEVDSGWLDKEYTFDTDGFKENDTWIVRPSATFGGTGCDGVYLCFSNVTSTGCTISWESMDDDLTINGEHTGEAYCSFTMGGLNGDDDYPCWVLDDLKIEFNWNYYGGKYKTDTYYVQIQCDAINAPLGEPFVNTTGDAVVKRVNN